MFFLGTCAKAPEEALQSISLDNPQQKKHWIAGESISLLLSYDRPIRVSGKPWIQIGLGRHRVRAEYQNQKDPMTLRFVYRVGLRIQAESIYLGKYRMFGREQGYGVVDKTSGSLLPDAIPAASNFIDQNMWIHFSRGKDQRNGKFCRLIKMRMHCILSQQVLERINSPEGKIYPEVVELVFKNDLKVLDYVSTKDHACVLLINGKVNCWGQNPFGVLGYQNQKNILLKKKGRLNRLRFLPLIKGERTIQISLAPHHSCALFESGRIKCWGQNQNGQLGIPLLGPIGDGKKEMGEHLPFVALGSNRKVVQVLAAGEGKYARSCALFEHGRVKCWGAAGAVQGNEDEVFRGRDPDSMGEHLRWIDFGVESKVIMLTAGDQHNCALFENHQVKCWGENQYGQLGQGHRESRGSKMRDMSHLVGFVALGKDFKVQDMRSSNFHNCVFSSKQEMKCWGLNQWGQLGIDGSENIGDEVGEMGSLLPSISLAFVPSEYQDFELASDRSCVHFSKGESQCWGKRFLESSQWSDKFSQYGGEQQKLLPTMPRIDFIYP